VATTIAAALAHEGTHRRIVYQTAGDTPIAAALDAL